MSERFGIGWALRRIMKLQSERATLQHDLATLRQSVRDAVEEIREEMSLIHERRLKLIDERKSTLAISERYTGALTAIDILRKHGLEG